MTSPAVTNPSLPAARLRKRAWVFDLLLISVLLAGLYLRMSGSNWGEYQYLHPDERFLIWVGTDISPVDNLAEYFDTLNSSLNPHNRGHGYYVYGTLPMFITRYVVQEVYGHSGFNEMTDIGRLLSTIVDMLTVFVVYLVGTRLYDRRIGLLGAAFTAFAVLHIQQSHFFTADTFIVFFTILAIYFAVLIARLGSVERGQVGGETRKQVEDRDWVEHGSATAVHAQRQVEDSNQGFGIGDQEAPGSTTGGQARLQRSAVSFFTHPLFILSIAFGFALGCAVASKINAFPVAAALPVAMLIRYFSLPRDKREREFLPSVLYLFVAAFTSLLVFRIAQPYAFAGPGFFNVGLNPAWLDDMRELRAGAAGDIDYPFALQWARRSITFSGRNMILYGMGIPMGLTAFAGFFWAGWRMLKTRCEWRLHILPWVWVAAYFTWQSLQFNPTMRYQLPVYPILALFAGWFLVALYERGKEAGGYTGGRIFRIAAVLLGILSLGLTAAWAFAFTSIYTSPITRNEASRWIFQNIPGPVNLHIETEDGLFNQPVYYPGGYTIQGSLPYVDTFTAQADGYITEFNIGFIQDQSAEKGLIELRVSIGLPGNPEPLAFMETSGDLSLDGNPSRTLSLPFSEPALVHAGGDYTITIEVLTSGKALQMDGPLSVRIENIDHSITQQLAYPTRIISQTDSYSVGITGKANGILREIMLSNVVEETDEPGVERMSVELVDQIHGEVLGRSILEAELSGEPQDFILQLDQPVEVTEGGAYSVRIRLESEAGQVRLQGSGIANESDFDDALPVRIDGYDGFAGMYPRGLVFQAYWGENPEKLARYLNVMDQAEYIVLTSSRQWGSIPRVPERYPMAAIYYRELIGCPADKEVEWCYNVAQEDTFEGRLGFELLRVFQSDPGLGAFHINDQPSEEAFTVYDHPKVFIFKKTSAFNIEEVRDTLGVVDFSQVMHLTPKKVPDNPANLMLPSHLFARQQAGGTWSELFSYEALQNRYPALGLVLWYGFIFVLGLAAYPFVRLALPGLHDRGYPLARITGLILLAYLAWISGSAGVLVTRGLVAAFFIVIVAVGGLLAYLQRSELKEELRRKRGYFLSIEALFLAFFVFDLLIRLGNPDLWHPWKGGERPMDFSYFNAIIKSTTFPPYDPWFSGGYLNYYYYGFVLVGMPVKLLGIVPSIAFNMILPTMFSMIAMGAFSVAWNLFLSRGGDRDESRHVEEGNQELGTGEREVHGSATSVRAGSTQVEEGNQELGTENWEETGSATAGRAGESDRGLGTWERDVHGIATAVRAGGKVEGGQYLSRFTPYLAGLAGALLMAVLGNLGTVKLIVKGYQALAAPGGNPAGENFLIQTAWTIQGFFRSMSGASLPFGVDAWYWNPSRAIPAPGDIEPITEFPFFTVLYGDPHAHLFALPVTLLAVAFAVGVVLGKARWKGVLGTVCGFLLGGLAIGAIYPINLSDIYTYLPLASAALGYSILRYFDVGTVMRSRTIRTVLSPLETKWQVLLVRAIAAAGAIALLAALAFLLYRPYSLWYGQAYTAIDRWRGLTTPTNAYFIHWGVFLSIFVSWFIYESYRWMSSTPLSSLRKLEKFRPYILGSVLLLTAAIVALIFNKAYIAWIALPLAVWAGVLILRPGMPDAKRAALFMIGTGLLITVVVEVVVVRGDIARMNTVFKFYLQVWTIFAVSAGAIVTWMFASLPSWRTGWRYAWQAGLAVLVLSAALYPLMGSMAKIKDRWNREAPSTLDGMAYMSYVRYNEMGTDMDLSQDYGAIRWMQENVEGSPVIVEANSRDLYRWYNRFSVYTGLPGVVGWEWHQMQQRALLPGNWVSPRVNEVNEFYETSDSEWARNFLRKYNVEYIIVGQLEQIHYPGQGINKFSALDGILWKGVYQDRDTIIYEVLDSNDQFSGD